MKLSDNEIIKALEESIELRFDDTEYATVRLDTLTNALALINRQKAKIERLEEENAKVHKIIPKMIETAKAEAIKEFAEKFKEKAGSVVTSCQGIEIYETKQYQISAVDFDNLVKEMVGKNDG